MKRNVLVVDGEEVFRFLNEQVIRQTGFECDVKSVANGEEALQLIYRCLDTKVPLPHFILLDLSTPIIDGYQFIQLFQNIKFGDDPKPKLLSNLFSRSAPSTACQRPRHREFYIETITRK